MAKFAIVILAAFAFQAASAGVHRHQEKTLTLGEQEYGLQAKGYQTEKFDVLFGQLETVAQDLTSYFQKALPNDRLVVKTLVWQSRELAHYIEAIIERLQAETQNYKGQVTVVLQQVISELRQIQLQFQQIAGYTTDVFAVSQLKNQFYKNVQRTVAQIKKLIQLIQTDSKQTKGDLYVIVKNLVTDFLYAFQSIYSHVQYYGVSGEQTPRHLVLQIEEVTKTLTGYLQGVTHFDAQRKYAIREYVQHVEAIMSRMQEFERTYSNVEINTIFQQVYSKLRRVLVPFVQFVETESIENVEAIRVELIKELQFVAEAFEQFVQYAQAGKYQTFFFEILGDYLYAIQHFRMQIQSEHQSFYGLYQGGLYGKQGSFGKSGYQGLYKDTGLYSKAGFQGLYKDTGLYNKAGFQGLYKDTGLYSKAGFQGLYKDTGLYSKAGFQGLYKDTGLYSKAGYQGLHKDSELYGKFGEQGLYKYGKSGYGKGFYGKYQGFAKYGQDLKQFEVQLQTIIRDLHQAFETISLDDVTAKQTLIHLIREYVQQLEVIVERLHQYVNFNAETDAFIFQQVAENLKQYIVAFHQFYATEYSTVELRSQIFLYVQKVATEFEKLVAGIEQTNGTFYNFVHEILSQYLTVTYDLYMHVQNIHQIAQYGYGPYARQYYGDNYSTGKHFGGKYGQYYGLQGQQTYETPRELVNQIEYVARDLSATFQNGMFFNQQHAQILAVQARYFAQIIKNVVDQLEAYEHIDITIQQVIYKLREVQLSFQQLAVYNVFTNVHQFRAEFDNYVQIAVAQIEKLALIAHEETHGDFFYVIKNVLNFFLYGLHDIHHQIQEVAQYAQFSQYGKGYGYGFDKYSKYGQQYRLGKSGQQYGYGKFDKAYGYGKYAQEYDFPKYGKKFAQEYDFPKYGQKYAQEYDFPKYGKKFAQEFDFPKYGQKYAQEYDFPKYGKKFAQEFDFPKYGQKYAQEYDFPKYGQKYAQEYDFPKYGKKFAQEFDFPKYGQKFNQEYKFDKYAHGLTGLSQYGKGYGYGYQHVPSFSAEYNQDAIRAY